MHITAIIHSLKTELFSTTPPENDEEVERIAFMADIRIVFEDKGRSGCPRGHNHP